jgi:hypothetical protein
MQPPTPGTKQLISSQQFAVSNEKIYVGCSRTIDGHQITTNPDVFAIVLFGGTGQNRIFRLQ